MGIVVGDALGQLLEGGKKTLAVVKPRGSVVIGEEL